MQTWLKQRVRSFKYAFAGIVNFIRQNANFKIMIVAAFIAITAGLHFNISRIEWLFIIVCIASVLSFEMINSALETICDMLTVEKKQKIKYIKDVAAGAVLILTIASIVVGVSVFLPYILKTL